MIIKFLEFHGLRHPSGIFHNLSILLVCLILPLASCHNSGSEHPTSEATMLKMADGLPDGNVYMLDSAASEIRWSIRQISGAGLSGVFRPARGCLLVEGSSVSAGFWEGDFFRSNFIPDSSNVRRAEGMKFLSDSVPALFRPGGNIIRMDLRQITRVIPRSEFRSNSIADSLFPSHDVSIQAEIADSSQGIRVPLRMLFSRDMVRLAGFFQLNLRDFGVLSNPVVQNDPKRWLPEARLDFRLFFRKLQKDKATSDEEKY